MAPGAKYQVTQCRSTTGRCSFSRHAECSLPAKGTLMTQKTKSGIEEVHILWISEGMSCDGDSVSVTAATLPSIEQIVLG
jgi:Ni,Fe-hydrogenase I small subunit